MKLGSVFQLALMALFFNVTAYGRTGLALSVLPNSVNSASSDDIILRVSGIAAGETVVLHRYLDVDGNGIIDATDTLLQRFSVTDNVAASIGGAVNISAAGDSDPTSGQIDVRLNFKNGSIGEKGVGKYLFKAVGPSGTATAPFAVTQAAFNQGATGKVTSSGVAVAGALVVAIDQTRDSDPSASAWTDANGNFTLKLPAGSFAFIAPKQGYYGSFNSAAQATIQSGQTITVNILINAANGPTISGSVVDSSTQAGLMTSFIFAESEAGEYSLILVNRDGTFSAPLPAGLWSLESSPEDAFILGYLPTGDKTSVSTTSGPANITIPLNKGTALVYGNIVNAADNTPFTLPVRLSIAPAMGESDIHVFSNNQGKYALAVAAGSWMVHPSDDNPALSGYLFSEENPISVNDGTASKLDFKVLAANRQIKGILKGSNNLPIAGVAIFASGFLSGSSYETQTMTDQTGAFQLNVVNGSWIVGASSSDLQNAGFQTVNNQTVLVNDNQPNITFIASAPTAHILGKAQDETGAGIPNITVLAFKSGSFTQADADASGNFNIGVTAGDWDIQLEQNALASRGLIGSGIHVTVVDGQTTNIVVVARHANFSIRGSVKNSSGTGLANVNVFASVFINNALYTSNARTDSSGNFQIRVANGSWSVSLSQSDLANLGYGVPASQTVNVNNSDATIAFTALPPAGPPSLSNVRRASNGTVTVKVNDTSTGFVVLEASSDLQNWFTVDSRNGSGAPYDVTDATAAGTPYRFYRVKRF